MIPNAANAPTRRVTPGCLLLMVGAVWLLVLGGWMIWTLKGQLKEIREFADTAARPVTVAQPTAEQLKTLQERIHAFGAAVGRQEKAELRLTADDINALLASEESAASMKQNARVESIGDTLKVQVSVAINGAPFSGERLYINGVADLLPEKHKELGVKLKTQNLTIPGKTISEGFLNHYKDNHHLDALLLDEMRKGKTPHVMDVLKQLTTIRLDQGAAVLEFLP